MGSVGVKTILSLSSTLKNVEDRIRNNDTETAVLIDKDGNVLLDKSNNLKDTVIFTVDETRKMLDNTLTHNHPSGTTFSDADVSMALRTALKEIRAVHKDGVYILTRNFGIYESIPTDYLKFADDFKARLNHYKQFTTDVLYERTQDADRCTKMLNDYRSRWLKNNAWRYGWTYKEVKYER